MPTDTREYAAVCAATEGTCQDDDDGVVVVPSTMCERVLEIAAEREKIEQVIKKELRKNPGSPGKYYPFNQNTQKLFEDYKSRGEA